MAAIEKATGAVATTPVKSVSETTESGRRARWWRRVGTKRRGFHYETIEGRRITDETQLERIKSLVIPPAWTDVRIAPSPRSPLQAIGVDAKERVQRIYDAAFAAKRARKKYAKVERFGERLPDLRRTINEHIELEGLPRERVLAVVVRLINDLYIRMGSEESVKRYRTYGVTTLRNRHLEIKRNGELHFNFIGKHHIQHRRIVVDKDLATLMSDIKAIGGARLFNYIGEDGKAHPVTPRDVNDYIKAATGAEFSAIDFRTWGGTLLSAVELSELGAPVDEKDAKKKLVKAVKRTADQLGNTPTVCRSCYVHPVVFERYLEGVTLDEFRPRKVRRVRRRQQPEYDPEEAALLKMLKAGKNGAKST
ncbi:MAG: DNA topoisomerase IB [Pyrinomonadaceae bacterium]|nr:DNA topoisomerase IB [Pyrinomonadaceae bacterium]